MIKFKIPWKFKLEKDFTSAYLKEFRKNWWCHKISDAWIWIKPFDFFWINWLWVFFAEVKIIDNEIFSFNQLRVNQFTSLKKIYWLKLKYSFLSFIFPIVIIYSKEKNDYILIWIELILEEMEKWNDKINIFNLA